MVDTTMSRLPAILDRVDAENATENHSRVVESHPSARRGDAGRYPDELEYTVTGGPIDARGRGPTRTLVPEEVEDVDQDVDRLQPGTRP